MFGRKGDRNRQKFIDGKKDEVEAAIQQSLEDYEWVQSYRPDVEATVRGHFKLLRDNHFSERMWLAYRGEF